MLSKLKNDPAYFVALLIAFGAGVVISCVACFYVISNTDNTLQEIRAAQITNSAKAQDRYDKLNHKIDSVISKN